MHASIPSILPISSPHYIVTVLTVLALPSPVHSECLLSYGALSCRVADATYSGIAKSAKVIAVKVMGWGCVLSLPHQGLSI